MKTLILGGFFDDNGGRPSGYIRQFGAAFHEKLDDVTVVNGGFFDDLTALLQSLSDYTWIYWMGDIPNDKPKIVNFIQEHAPHASLMISKNNRQGKYTANDLHTRLNAAKAHGLLEFTQKDNRILGQLMDKNGHYRAFPCADIPDFVHGLLHYHHEVTNPCQNHPDNECEDK